MNTLRRISFLEAQDFSFIKGNMSKTMCMFAVLQMLTL